MVLGKNGFICWFCLLSFSLAQSLQVGAAEPCKSGLPEGKKPGPYSAVVVTGPERGQSYCYICETADRPAVIVFARTLTNPLGKLVRQLDKALAEHKKADLRGWVTFLAKDTISFEDKVAHWGKAHAISNMPLAVFTDNVGPPSYRIARAADVTVLFFVKRKTVANFAFRAGELTDAGAAEVLKALPKIVGGNK